ncbi:hypothetical protein BGZ54_009244 [Gamsiella multidivaricata]|nr:hypothetical protein BGZ54_009244 [Gamsiella multidivaricata]
MRSTESNVLESQTSALSIENDITIASTSAKKAMRRTRKTVSPSTATIVTTTSTTGTTEVIKEKVAKTSEEQPWTKRPAHVPSYAKDALDHLCKMDPALAPLIAKHPYRIYTDHDTNYFRVLTRTILGQQIHWKAARSIIYKFVSYYFPDKVTVESLDSGDKTFPTPHQVLSTSMDQLRHCGLSERKASYVQDLAKHFVEGKITFTDKTMLQSMLDKDIASQLLCVRGIGPWTVDMFMMDSLERLDVLPTLDLGVRRGMEKHFAGEYKNGLWGTIVEDTEVDGNGVLVKKIKKKAGVKAKGKAKNGEMTCEDMERMAERWRPYRSIASWYMWRNAGPEGVIAAPI